MTTATALNCNTTLTAKIAALSSRKIDKYKYLASEERIHSDQEKVLKQAKFMFSPLRKALENQKTIAD